MFIAFSLPLRFWSNAIKNPDYIFDIRAGRSVQASMDVIGQLFHDVHDTKTHQLGQVTERIYSFYFQEKHLQIRNCKQKTKELFYNVMVWLGVYFVPTGVLC